MSTLIQSAMVLAAGMGTRMRPLTDDRPKPMVSVAGRPLIDHVLARIEAGRIETAVINVHYKADVLLAHLVGRTGPRIVISDERDLLLDTGGGVRRALPLLGADPFLIHNSDSIWTEAAVRNLDRLAAAFDAHTMDSLMLLAPTHTSIGYAGAGDFDMDPAGRLARRPAGGTSPHAFAGVSIAHPRLFDAAPDGAFSLNILWDRALRAGRLFGMILDGTWMHVGDPQSLAEAEARIRHHG